jgi:hypothetical protein
MTRLAQLPAYVDTNGTWEEVRDRLYGHFCGTFKCNPRRRIRGKLLVFDGRCIDSDLEEGFWHIVTRGKGADRLLDTERARRISWLPAMLDGSVPGLSTWVYADAKGIPRLYYWLEAEKYVVLLEKPRVVVPVTAYHVDHQGQENDLRRRRAAGRPI